MLAFVSEGKNENKVIRQPLMMDFQMVGSGYDDKDPWQNLLIPKKNDGGKPVGTGTKMTYRYYVQDMTFAVLLQVPQTFVNEVTEALCNPVWDLYLGRKNCVPTEFIYQGVFDSVEQVITAGNLMAKAKGKALAFQVLQGEHEGEIITLNDVPLQFGNHKKYRDRRVTVQKI